MPPRRKFPAPRASLTGRIISTAAILVQHPDSANPASITNPAAPKMASPGGFSPAGAVFVLLGIRQEEPVSRILSRAVPQSMPLKATASEWHFPQENATLHSARKEHIDCGTAPVRSFL